MTKRTANWRNFLEMTIFNGPNNPSCRRFCGMEWHKKASEFAQEAEGVWSQLK